MTWRPSFCGLLLAWLLVGCSPSRKVWVASSPLPTASVLSTPSARPASPDEPRWFTLPLDTVASAEVLDEVDAYQVELPLYPVGVVNRSRQITLHLQDGRFYRQIEVVLDSPDSVDTCSAWYQHQNLIVQTGRGLLPDNNDYRIWIGRQSDDNTRIELFRYRPQ